VGLRCKRCGSEDHVKNGLMRNKQRYLCKACGLNFTDTPARGKPLALKVAAVLLYVSGLSMNRTAKLLGVSTPTIQAWLEQFAQAYAQKPEPEGRAVVIELDEMWHYLKKSPSRSGSGRLGIGRLGIVLQGGWWTGNAAVVTALGLEGLGSCYRAAGGLGMRRS
jgi:transposase